MSFLVLCSLAVIVVSKHGKTGPYYPQANLPFTCESEAFEQAKIMVDCIHNYWLLDHKYDGMKGFQKMWGKDGYFFNESTSWI